MLGLGFGPRYGSVAILGKTFNPATYGTVALWLKADSLALEDEDVVDTWPDSSGNGNDATQGTFSKMPLYIASVMNGRPVIRFDGVDDTLLPNISITGAELSVFMVLSFNDSATNRGALSVVKTGNAHDFDNAESAIVAYRGTASTVQSYRAGPLSFVNISTGDPFVYGHMFDGASSTAYKNGTPGTPVESFGLFNAGFAAIGSRWEGGAPSNSCGCDIAEVLIYSSALTSDGHNAVNQYLAAKYGITLS